MKKSRQFNHQVIEIDQTVKNLITLYIDQFPNQREAAKKVGVSACTINTYNTRSTHIALYVFDKIIKELTKAIGEKSLAENLDGVDLDDIRSNAKRQNGAQIDNVMYVINPEIRKVLDIYIEPFPSREAGGAHLGLNPRTFTAYFKGQISSFPRKYFWEIIKELEDRGHTQEELLDTLGTDDWDKILVKKKRSHTLQVTKEELIEKLINAFKVGSLREKDIQRSVANAAERLFGNLGSAIRATMKALAARKVEEVKDAVQEDRLGDAVKAFNEFEQYLCLYRNKEIQINKALPRKKKLNVNRIMRQYLKQTQEVYDVVNDALIEREMSLHKTDPNLEQILENPDAEFENYEPIRYTVVRRYSPDKIYRIGEVVDHPGLGVGEILSSKSRNRITVQFFNKKYGVKELVTGGVA